MKILKTINNVICIVVNIYLLDIVLRFFFKKTLCTPYVTKLCPLLLLQNSNLVNCGWGLALTFGGSEDDAAGRMRGRWSGVAVTHMRHQRRCGGGWGVAD